MCCVQGRFWCLGPAGRTTDWISSELMRRVTSGLLIFAVGSLEEMHEHDVYDLIDLTYVKFFL